MVLERSDITVKEFNEIWNLTPILTTLRRKYLSFLSENLKLCHPVVKEALNVSNLLLSDTTTDFQSIDKLVVHLIRTEP